MTRHRLAPVALGACALLWEARALAQNESDPPANVEDPAPAPTVPPPAPPVAAPAPPPPASPFTGRLYGFIEARGNYTTALPTGATNPDGSVERQRPSFQHGLANFNLMAQGALYSRYRYYFNLRAANSEGAADLHVGVRNAWVEASIFGDYLNVRAGKLYRRMGLYNEILDTSPSFIGVEAPFYLGGDRPLMPRTTNSMIHGKASSGSSTVAYAAMIGLDEPSTGHSVLSPGVDLNYSWDSKLLIGTSFFTSGGSVSPSVQPGEGAVDGGVAPWMRSDRYSVFGGYGRVSLGGFMIGAEAWISPHSATRDPEKVVQTAINAESFNDTNRQRFGVSADSPNVGTVRTAARYTYTTFDVRGSYTFEVGTGPSGDPVELTPYVNVNYLQDRESIADEAYGGDEVGRSPRGNLLETRAGIVLKPVPQVAFKAEATHLFFDYGSTRPSANELWLSLTYAWQLIGTDR